MRPLAILVTGDPVPTARAARGSFVEMIQRGVGTSWPGPWLAADCRPGTRELPEPAELGGIIVTGSSASVTERAAWILETEAYLSRASAAGTAIFGICFGHQLLGQALGGQVEKNPDGRQIGTVELELSAADPLAEPRVRPFAVNTTHRDVVTRLPPAARVLGTTPRDRHAFVRFSERVWGVQFHPEFDAVTLSGYISERREILAAEGFDVDELLACVGDARPGAAMLSRFAELCAEHERRASG